MQLEDHLGDILRKARKMNGVAASSAAEAAGLSEKEYAGLENSGVISNVEKVAALGKLLGLSPRKLERIAGGWLPEPVAVERWRKLAMFTSSAEGLTVNAFLIWDETSREAALFDTGVDAAPILDCLRQNQLNLSNLFITHSHWDHVDALGALRTSFPAAQIHSGAKAAPKSQRLQPGEIFSCGKLSIAHRPTPGHTEDGVSYLVTGWPDDAPPVAVVGDTVFAGSIANGNGQWELARKVIVEQILSLPPMTLLCPGHGPLTTVAQERENNPFF